MESSEAKLTEIGRKIRESLDEETDAAAELHAARTALIDRMTARDGRRSRGGRLARRLRLGFGLTLAGATLAGAVVMVVLPRPISFQVTTSSVATVPTAPGRLGDIVEANDTTTTALNFSEGSAVLVQPGGRVRVLALESDGARVLIESGRADVAIAHPRRKVKWSFEAGPLKILVTGTKFQVGWNPKDQAFALDLKEGSVVVSGACLPEPRTVTMGESVQLSCLPAGASAAAPAQLTPSLAPPPAKTPPVTSGRGVARRDEKLSDDEAWRTLVAGGHFSDGLRAAERAGFARVCRTANDVELLALADAARLSGRTARAIEALMVLRQRFPGTTSAATGAFALGRIAFERRSAYPEAARWFGTYLDEQPSGPLMGDAIGRLMEARHRAGDRSSARRDAERYLQRFPEGPYAGTARAILTE